MMYLIEFRRLNKSSAGGWYPIGVVSSTTTLDGNGVLDTVRQSFPALVNYALRIRKFRRVPGIFDNKDNPALGLVLTIQ